MQRLEHLLLFHVIGPLGFTVDAQPRVLLLNLPRLDSRQRLDARQAGVFGQCHWDGLERVREGSHSELPRAHLLVGRVRHSKPAGNLGRPTAYTTRLSRTKLRTMQSASWIDRLISSMIILLAPRTKMVTALLLWQSSMKSIRSLVVPNDT